MCHVRSCVSLEHKLDSMCSSSDPLPANQSSNSSKAIASNAEFVRQLLDELGNAEVEPGLGHHVRSAADCLQIARAALAAATRARAAPTPPLAASDETAAQSSTLTANSIPLHSYAF